jgi:2,4-dienoyl-CoA reductase-like NADH-dependent reductase (Old Yellow Enzyme family)/NADPH-dependent 2,4-dienoyl-CoA reductase/sulfur reductase-like enzyme
MYPHLLSPASIGSMQLRNRMVMAPMGVEIVGDDGKANEGIIRYYEERARGGVGLIITEVCAIAYPRGANSVHQLGLSDDSFIPAMKELTARVQGHGAKIAVQLVHHGKVSRVDIKEGRDVLVPSIPDWHGSYDMVGDLTADELGLMAAANGDGGAKVTPATTDDIAQIVDEFAAAAVRAQTAGFDGVEIHGAHGYLISGFLSPQWNLRDDEYGGSVENRSRFLCDVLREVKRRTGDDYPVWCRLDALEYRTPNGIVFDDAMVTARLAVEAGADAIHLSAYGDMTSGPAFTDGTLPHREAKHAALTGQLKRKVDVPVIAVGRIRPEIGDEMIAHGKADLIAMGRQMLADPETARKVTEGREADVRPCINCYVCVAQPFFDQRVRCAVNPVLANEVDLGEVERTKAPAAKQVVVVGGGPAGMEAARVAALRGHSVTLFEASDHLGGALQFAALVYQPNLRLLGWLTRQMDELGVDVHTGTAIDPETVRALSPDVVIVATGAARERSTVPGADRRLVVDGDDLRSMLTGSGDVSRSLKKLPWFGRVAATAGRRLGLLNNAERLARLTQHYMPIGKRVAIIGGGLVGIELAEFMVDRGRAVTVLDDGPTMATEMAHPRRWRVLTDLRDHGATLVTGATVDEITDTEVRYTVGGSDTADAVAVDSVVIATGLVSDLSVTDAFREAGLAPVAIGDCTGVGYLEGAIREGFLAGLGVG